MSERSEQSSSNDTLAIRSATAADFAAACDLLAELGRPAATPETRARLRDVYERQLATPTAFLLLAERGDRPIGLLSLHIRERLGQAAPEAWIPDFVVTAAEQGSGAAVQLLAKAIELGRKHDCYRMILESHYHRQRAYRFYEREGFADVGKCFSLPLLPAT